MQTFELNIEFSKNEGLVMSPSNLLNLYLPGIPICYPNGGRISMETIRQKLLAAQKFLENFLSIKINKQLITEEQDYNRQEFMSWGYIRTVFPINVAKQLEGKINEISRIKYPESWLSVKKSSDSTKFRNLHILPNVQGAVEETQFQVIYTGLTPTVGWFGSDYIPNYWKIKYCTGWDIDEVPEDIFDAIGKIASIQMLAITGDLIYGAGIGNQSISIDGITQTYSTTKGAGRGAFAGQIDQLQKELIDGLENLKAEYLGIRFRVV